MSTAVLVLALALYLAAAAAYAAAFVRPALTRTARAAFLLAGAGFAVQGAAIGIGCGETGGLHLLTVSGGAGLVGWLGAGAFLVVQRRVQKAAGGGLVLPVVFAAVLPGAIGPTSTDTGLAALAELPALRLHVITAAGGIALLALACAFGIMFLLQERELKEKRFGPLLSRLPSLHALDRINAALVAGGFAVFTVAVVTGSLVARKVWCASWEWDGQQVASVVVWLVFGAMVLARRVGARGRRQAVLTLVAFSIATTWLVGVRHAGGTRHAGFETAAVVTCAGPA